MLHLDTYSLIKNLTLGLVTTHTKNHTRTSHLVQVMLIIKNSTSSMLHKAVAIRETKHPFRTFRALPTTTGLPDCFIHGPEKHKWLHRLEMVATMQRKLEPTSGPAGKSYRLSMKTALEVTM